MILQAFAVGGKCVTLHVMQKFTLGFALLLAAPCLHAGSVVITSPSGTPSVLHFEAQASAGLNSGIFVADGMTGVRAVYTASSPSASVSWLRYSNLGGGYAETVGSVSHSGTEWTLDALEGDMGYIIEDGDERFYFWVVDYSRHHLALDALMMGSDRDCDFTTLALSGNAAPIFYYSINGRQMTLSRELSVSYSSLEWSEDADQFVPRQVTEVLESAESSLRVPAPLCETSFTLTGDRFLAAWNRAESVTSPSYPPTAVSAHTSATRLNEAAENQSGGSSADDLGGSAPAEVEFRASVTDGAIFTEWQFSSYPDFDDIQLRVNDTDYTHTFNELGTTYVRFVCDNADGTCEYLGDVYQVSIGESALLCPNAFSPGASEGVNDEWRVSFKSIVSFECHIFDRNGRKMITLKDPSQGWDGKYGGKLVPAGVYYYVIKARGADGKHYNLSGDINIINYK